MASSDAVTKIRVKYDGKSAERGLGSLKKTLTATFGAVGANMVRQYMNELGKMGIQAEMVEKNFRNFAKSRNRDATEMKEQLRKATMGMVDDMTLQQKAMQAMIGGVKFDDLIVSMEYVSKFAAATGTDVNQKLQTTMTGLARKSAQFLDDIGIQVMRSEDVVGDAIDQMKEKMGQFTSSEEDAYVQAEKLNAELENQKVLLGKELQPIYFASILSLRALAKAATGITKHLKINLKMLWDSIHGRGLENKRIEQHIEYAETLKDKQKAIDYLQDLRNKKQEQSMTMARKLMALEEKGGKGTVGYLKQKLAIETHLQDIKAQDLKYEEAIKKIQDSNVKGPAVEPGGKTVEELQKEEKEKEKIRKEAAKKQKAFQEDLDNVQKMLLEQSIEGRLKLLDDEFKEKHAILTKAGLSTIELEKWRENEKTRILEEGQEDRLEIMRQAVDIERSLLEQSHEGRKQLAVQDYLENLEILKAAGRDTTELTAHHNATIDQMDKTHKKEEEQQEQEKWDKKVNMLNNNINVHANTLNTLSSLSAAFTNRELRELEKRNLSEEEYEKEKSKIMAEAAERNRAFARAQQAIVIARTISDVISAGIGSARDTFGGPITRGIAMGSMIAAGMAQVAVIQAQNFQRGFLGETDRVRQPDDISANIGRNEAVIPGPQYAIHEDAVKAIVNNTANTASGMRRLRGGQTVNNFYGLSEKQVANIIRDQERRSYTGKKL